MVSIRNVSRNASTYLNSEPNTYSTECHVLSVQDSDKYTRTAVIQGYNFQVIAFSPGFTIKIPHAVHILQWHETARQNKYAIITLGNFGQKWSGMHFVLVSFQCYHAKNNIVFQQAWIQIITDFKPIRDSE